MKKIVSLFVIIILLTTLMVSCSDDDTTGPNDTLPSNQPNNPTPADNATDIDLVTTLSWECSDPDEDDLTYDVYFGTSTNPGLVSENQSELSFTPDNLEYETTYYWKIVADDGESETEGNIWQFTIGEEPEPIPMIFVEGGTFEMGAQFNEGQSDELPVHEVTLDDFYIGQYEVTHTEYIEFLNAYGVGSNGSYNGTELIDMDDSDCAIDHNGSFYFAGSSYASSPECPVIEVTWYGVVVYCNWKSEQEGLTPCYNLSDWSCDWDADGYRLPTEAEWEYAARGGVNWQDNYKYSGTTDNLGDYAWYGPNSSYQTHEVGTKLPNQLDIYDMSGNVWEWCWDWYDEDYYSVSPTLNPAGPGSGQYSVLRGGSWYDIALNCRVANRFRDDRAYGGSGGGFRILRTQN